MGVVSAQQCIETSGSQERCTRTTPSTFVGSSVDSVVAQSSFDDDGATFKETTFGHAVAERLLDPLSWCTVHAVQRCTVKEKLVSHPSCSALDEIIFPGNRIIR
ncbi:unnamed protein product [Pylaiella littoralis]